MNVLHPHRTFPEDNMPVETAIWWRENAGLFLRCLTDAKYHKPFFNSAMSGNLIIYPPKCNYMEGKMNGRKSRKPSERFGIPDDKSLPFRWINIPLGSDDLAALEREEATIELLAQSFIQLGVRGFGLSVKYDSARKSYSVSIYGSDTANHMQPCGVSGSSSDLRDALLVSLYKFDTGLQGSFDGCTLADSVFQPQRFR